MSEVPFHATRLGKRFSEHTVPRLVEQPERAAVGLEALAEHEEHDQPTSEQENKVVR